MRIRTIVLMLKEGTGMVRTSEVSIKFSTAELGYEGCLFDVIWLGFCNAFRYMTIWIYRESPPPARSFANFLSDYTESCK
jgi:hypothetical protein